ncbi:MAG: hypothetical protein J2P36_34030, partial [Ktedonobacteraceae bacterium]|nr:hypothetical protein [Ktedonobacteraceae bacterium]
MTGDSGDFSRGMDGGMGDGEGFKYYFLQRMADRYAEIKGRRSSGDGEDSSAAESASGDASRPFVGVWNAPTFGIGGLLEASAQRLTIDDKGHWVVKAHGSVEDVEPYAWLDQQLRNLPGTAFFGDSGERKTWWDANMPLQGEFSQVPVGKTKLGRQIWEHPLSLAFSSLEGVSALQHHHDGNANGVLLSFADGKLTSRTEATLVEIGWSQEAVRELNTRLDSLLQTYKEGGNAGTKEALLTIAQHAEEVGNFIETQNKAALERNVDALVHHIYQQVPGTDREDVKIVVQDSFQKKGALDAEPMQQLLSRLISSGLDPRQVNNDLKLALGKLHEAHKRNDITQELGFSFQALSVINPDVARADEGYKAIRDTLSGEPDVWKGFDVFSRELRMHLERAQSVSEDLERIGLKDIPKV